LFQETTPTTVKVKISPPNQPNGLIRYYNVLVNDTVVSLVLYISILIEQWSRTSISCFW